MAHGHGGRDGGEHGAHEHGAHEHSAQREGRHGNPADLRRYLENLEGPDRAAWQKPDEVIAALSLAPGAVACEIGAGPGYFALRLARAVGAAGRVFAVDVEPALLTALRDRIEAAQVTNVTPVLGLPGDPLLPEASCDLALIVDTYHHFADGPAYLGKLLRALRPGGRIVNIDFLPGELPVGPPPGHRVAREEMLLDAERAGLHLVREHGLLPYQYFLVLAPR
jgi:SAM-dependent methyltransferase